MPNDHIYGVTGRGRDEAARRLKAAQNAGLTHLAKLDIVACFQSINPDSLYQLPLPKEVTRRALATRNMTFVEWEPQIGTTASQRLSGIPMPLHSESGPRGLLQGSPVSNLILAWLLNDMPVPERAMVLICADNIAIAAADPTTRQAAIDTLVAYFERDCPAGPLNLCPAVYAGPGTEPLDFLSYEFDPDQSGISIAHAALSKLEGRLADLEADFEDGKLSEPRFDISVCKPCESETFITLLRRRVGFEQLAIYEVLNRADFRRQAGKGIGGQDALTVLARLRTLLCFHVIHLTSHGRLGRDLNVLF